ncbi:MAG: Bacterial regulatory proteins, gntR family [Lentisphaerae bacterium ADurb.Bin242]|nr:MAG: Bacterial regulatory proteins, gntR family [Lentisphaerae bacterium ADurb.Bin242]
MEKSTKKDQKAKLRKNLLTLINEYSLADRLPSERDLAATLGVTRYLLRDCLSELDRENVIRRGKTRQGMQMIGLHPWTYRIGIVLYDGRPSPCIDNLPVFQGVMDFFDRHPDYLPQILTFSNLGDLSLQMEQYELSGCIWVISHSDYMMKFVSMPQKNLIRHVFAVPGGTAIPLCRLPGNMLWIGRESRECLLAGLIEAGADRIAYVGIDSSFRSALKNTLSRLGAVWDDSMWVNNVADIDEKLPEIIRGKQINAILCDGPIGFYEHLLEAVSRLPRNNRPILAVSDNWRFRKALMAHPELNGIRVLCESFSRARRIMGEAAGEMLVESLRTGRLQEPRKLLSQDIYFAEYADLATLDYAGSKNLHASERS